MKYTRLVLTIVFCAVAGSAQDRSTKPDNTKANKREQVTADQQKMNAADQELTQKIRKAIVADKSLSTYAHNVKIISQDGVVTLKGPVRSSEEKKAIVAKAVAAAGNENKVTDQITVAP